MNTLSKKHKKLKDYYGLILGGAHDLKTNTCRCNREAPSEIKAIIREIDHEIVNRFYGCGSPIPPLLNGCTVLDLGCGTGRDVYIASKLVGENGYVIGVDMTDEQLEVGKSRAESMAKKFGYGSPNVDFRKGYIEDLNTLGIENESIDVVISNCAINLSPTKSEVFKEIFRVLKQGGELYFSDIFAGQRVPEHLSDDPVLHGECLGGAMYLEDFRRLLNKLGCPDYRTVTKSRIALGNPEIEKKIGMVDFYSMTVRAFKLDDLEDICEDYGQIAVYKGTITGHPHYFDLDDHHIFISNKPMLVCGNTASMLQHTRLREHFAVHGNRTIHYGPFNCAPAAKKSENPDGGRSGGVCC
ncbi:MAG: methyltransferase domain-containing protein [Nitrospirota bacterium]